MLKGNDTFRGGLGTDTFMFSVGDGADTITDFEAGDRIEIAGVSGGFPALVIEQNGSHTVIRYGDGDTIRLSGVSCDNRIGTVQSTGEGNFMLSMTTRILCAALALAGFLGACKSATVKTVAELRPHLAEAKLSAAYYGSEGVDRGVRPTGLMRTSQFHAPTPVSHASATTVTTVDLVGMLKADPPPVLVDTLGGSGGHRSLPGAYWLPGGGIEDRKQALGARLAELTGGDKDRALVFFCQSWECWLSYNAALSASSLGYTNVNWYRGGAKSWKAAGLPTDRANRSW